MNSFDDHKGRIIDYAHFIWRGRAQARTARSSPDSSPFPYFPTRLSLIIIGVAHERIERKSFFLQAGGSIKKKFMKELKDRLEIRRLATLRIIIFTLIAILLLTMPLVYVSLSTTASGGLVFAWLLILGVITGYLFASQDQTFETTPSVTKINKNNLKKILTRKDG